MNTLLLYCHQGMVPYEAMSFFTENLKTIAWPTVCLTILFVLKEPLIELIKRINKIGNDKTGVYLESTINVPQKDNQPIESNGGISNDLINKVLNLVSKATLESVENSIKQETDLDNISTESEKKDLLFNYSKALYLVKEFREIYQIIFGSQIKLLQSLNGSKNDNEKSLLTFYESASLKYPEAYNNYKYSQYLHFLEVNNLIKRDDNDIIVITIFGRDFLKFITENGYSIDKLY